MAAQEYKFSVGQLSLSGSELQPIGVATGITVSYDGAPVEFRGGDYRLPLAIELGDESVEVTAETSKFAINDDPAIFLTNNIFNLTLSAGPNGGGLVGTINNLKITSYEVTSGQADYVTASITMQKLDNENSNFTKSTS